MTTDPTKNESWREAYKAWHQPWVDVDREVIACTSFQAGYLAAQPKRPSVEEVANIIRQHARISSLGRVVLNARHLATMILALFESPAHDR